MDHLQRDADHQLQQGVEAQLLQAEWGQGDEALEGAGICTTAVSVCDSVCIHERRGVSVWERPYSPDVHEHVAEETPDLCPVAGMVDQWALHEVRLIGLQHPLVQHDPVAHEHDDLRGRN